jgi:hypothetical protein
VPRPWSLRRKREEEWGLRKLPLWLDESVAFAAVSVIDMPTKIVGFSSVNIFEFSYNLYAYWFFM